MIDLISRYVIPATFSRLPSLASDNAAIMLLAIGLQESRFLDRRQRPLKAGLPAGPARGYWQFERISTLDVFARDKSSQLAREFCAGLGYQLAGHGLQEMVDRIHPVLEHNDILACGMARLKLLLIPAALPLPGSQVEAWRQYVSSWQPGKPKQLTWAAMYSEALGRVQTSTGVRFT